MNDRLKIGGYVVIRNADTGEILAENHNLVVYTGLELIAKLIKKESVNGCTYIALGTGTADVDESDEALDNEIARSQITQTELSNTNLTFSAFFTGSDVTTTLTECGLFGEDATTTLESGTLVSRMLKTYNNTAGNNLSVSWTLNIGNVTT